MLCNWPIGFHPLSAIQAIIDRIDAKRLPLIESRIKARNAATPQSPNAEARSDEAGPVLV